MRKLILGLLLLGFSGCALAAVPPAPLLPLPPGVKASLVPDARAFQDYLTEHLPLSRPVELEMVDDLLETHRYGTSAQYPDAYVIEVDARLPGTMVLQVIVHEWAHILLWDAGVYPTEPHGEEWGRMYSKVFQVAVGESP